MRSRRGRAAVGFVAASLGVACCKRPADETVGGLREPERRTQLAASPPGGTPPAPATASAGSLATRPVGANLGQPQAARPAENATRPNQAMDLIQNLRRRKATYRDPTSSERAAYSDWLEQAARTLDASPRSGAEVLRSLAGSVPAGFGLSRVDGAGGELWLLHELTGAERGAGVVLLRSGPARPVIVEAPHTFFDGNTLEIAWSAFEALGARALLVNTVHRFGRSGASRPDDAPSAADVAHNGQSFFAAAHEAVARGLSPHRNGGGLAVQIHGFRDEQAPGAEVIVSAAGTGARLDGVLASLRSALLPEQVRHYPTEVRVLGGTTNVQAVWSRSQGLPFVHLELSRTLRTRLAADELARRRFGEALGAALEEGAASEHGTASNHGAASEQGPR